MGPLQRSAAPSLAAQGDFRTGPAARFTTGVNLLVDGGLTRESRSDRRFGEAAGGRRRGGAYERSVSLASAFVV